MQKALTPVISSVNDCFAQTKDGTLAKEVKIRLPQAHSAMTRLAILWKTKP